MFHLRSDRNTVRYIVGGHVDNDRVRRQAERFGNISFCIDFENMVSRVVGIGSGRHDCTCGITTFGQIGNRVGRVYRLQVGAITQALLESETPAPAAVDEPNTTILVPASVKNIKQETSKKHNVLRIVFFISVFMV